MDRIARRHHVANRRESTSVYPDETSAAMFWRQADIVLAAHHVG
jgi:hypothetical protein